MKKEILFSSKSEMWETPQDLFDRLNRIYHFQIDVCAIPENAKCEVYFTPEQDGLKSEWGGYRCWCNPPYGRKVIKWVRKADESENALTVMLLPTRTDTKWFHDYIYGKRPFVFLRGRLKFTNTITRVQNSATFPSMLVIFDNRRRAK